MNVKYKLFKPAQTVVDLGYAPGSWSQVAIDRTAPNGRVVGIDILPVQPPRGVSTIQGNFLSPEIQAEVRAYVQDPNRGRPRKRGIAARTAEGDEDASEDTIEETELGYVEMERHAELDTEKKDVVHHVEDVKERMTSQQRDKAEGRVVDIVLSDMSEPWEQTTGMWIKSVSNPYHRMMNTSGVSFKDHAGSMVSFYAQRRN